MQQFWLTNKAGKDKAEIFIYGYIDPFDVSAGKFVKELRELEREYKNIDVRINSAGGSVFEGLAIYNAMISSPANIETWNDGVSASMGSILLLGGKKVHMSRGAMVMTHQPKVGSYGTKEDHDKNKRLLEGIEATMLAIYAAKTGKDAEACRKAYMNGKDNWFDADQAIAEGLVDEIYDNQAVKVDPKKKDAKVVWEMYSQQQFAAVFNNSNNNMKQYSLPAAVIAALKLGDNADQAAFEAKINDLVAEAAKVPQLSADLEAANTAKKKAEDDLADEKKNSVKATVTQQLETALTAKKITMEQKTLFEKQYAEDPEGLKALLATMKPYMSVVPEPGASNENDPQVKALMAKSGKELWTSGDLDKLKALSPEGYKLKYKEAFDEEAPAES